MKTTGDATARAKKFFRELSSYVKDKDIQGMGRKLHDFDKDPIKSEELLDEVDANVNGELIMVFEIRIKLSKFCSQSKPTNPHRQLSLR